MLLCIGMYILWASSIVNAKETDKFTFKFYYIVPHDIDARKDIGHILNNIANDVSMFFSNSFGRTLTYTTPLYQVLHVNDTVNDIVHNNEHVVEYIQQLIDSTYQLKRERYVNYIAHIMITEIPFWMARGGGMLASFGGKELDYYQQYKRTYPFDHEIGHMLGLSHSNTTRQCLLEYDIETPDTYTFMTQPPLLIESFIENYEKTLLLNSTFHAQGCLLTRLVWWPHPSNYFKKCTKLGHVMRSIDELSRILSNWGPCTDIVCWSDLNCNGKVDLTDLTELLTNWK